MLFSCAKKYSRQSTAQKLARLIKKILSPSIPAMPFDKMIKARPNMTDLRVNDAIMELLNSATPDALMDFEE